MASGSVCGVKREREALVVAREAPCQLMQRVRLQMSISASNSRAKATEGNLAASWVSDNPDILRDQMVGL
ncbi:hypothetical protein VAWG006_25230 [Aeromonas enteropelogenes]|nr:hypothetical protein VAWG006_25230 [Aeromonas enteropelogenes]